MHRQTSHDLKDQFNPSNPNTSLSIEVSNVQIELITTVLSAIYSYV